MKVWFFFLAFTASIHYAWAQDPGYPATSPAAQNLTKAEYFIDTDPGFGNGTNIPVTAATNLSNIAVAVNTAGLSGGLHRLWVRTRSVDGKWSLSNYKEFLVDFNPSYPAATSLQNITKAEYFIDTDPGFGNGTNIPVAAGTNLSNVPVTVNTTDLSNGPHRVWVRTRGADGKWSLSNFKEFLVDFNPAYPAAPTTVQNLTKAEYFVDNDPGFGNGTNIPVTAAANLSNVIASVNTSSLSIGVHRVYLRTRGAEGRWSLTAQGDFLVDENPAYPAAPAAPGNLVYAEYFFDTDPGWGKGTTIVFSPAVNLSNRTVAVNTSSLSDGEHRFYLRTLDDWSLTGFRTFVKGSVLPLRLLSFYARSKEGSVDLEWKTSSEVATAHFDVERSADGVMYSTIGTTQALNRPGEHTYLFTDRQPLNGKSFYRLKQVDQNGSFTYSAIVPVNRGKALDIQVFPNPAQNHITVTVPVAGGPQTLMLLNAKAQVVKQLIVPAGASLQEVSLEALAGGVYFIRWQFKEDVRVKSFTKK